MNKADFPIFQNHPKLVYLDSAATSQKPQCVIDAIKRFYEESNANVHRGIYKLSEEATSLYEEAREILALFLRVNPKQVIFVPGVTAGLNYVALGYANKIIVENSADLILATEMEHHSNLIPWQQLSNRKRITFDLVKVAQNYRLDLKDLEQKLDSRKVKILAITHMSNTLGTVNPIQEIVSIVRNVSPETKIVVDGAQFAPHYPLDLSKLDVDFYSIAGHKLLGPTGIGVLTGKESLLAEMDPVLTGGGMIRKVERKETTWDDVPHRFEAGTPHIAGAVGLAEAVRYLQKVGLSKLVRHEQELIEYMLAKILDFPGLKLFGPSENDSRGSVFSFEIEGIHPHDLAQLLDGENIAVRAGHHCNQLLMHDVLKVTATTRASLYIYNDYQDIDKFIEGLEKTVRRLKR